MQLELINISYLLLLYADLNAVIHIIKNDIVLFPIEENSLCFFSRSIEKNVYIKIFGELVRGHLSTVFVVLRVNNSEQFSGVEYLRVFHFFLSLSFSSGCTVY